MCETQQTRNFEYVDEDDIDPELKCSICTDPFIDPVFISTCNHTFCRLDIEKALANKSACPLCRYEPVSCDQLKPASSTVINFLNRLLVECIYCHDRNIERGVIDEHIKNTCPNIPVPCSAEDLSCRWTGIRAELADHLVHCTFESMRPILSQIILLKEQHTQIQLENQELKLLVNGLDHRCKQLEMRVIGSEIVPLRSTEINISAKWLSNSVIIAGGNRRGHESNQLSYPQGLYVNGDTIYVADSYNHRIVEWKLGADNGKIVAGGNGPGNEDNQLNNPTDVIVDRENECLLICDRENRRVVRWSLHDGTTHGETIISDIDCNCLTMDDRHYLYVTDIGKHAVIRWKLGETQGKIVAGGNGSGCRFNQLTYPTFVFVDQNYCVYVSDYENHRVMKWIEDATEGMVVAGGLGCGSSRNQLSFPGGVIVDQWGTIYVSDSGNHQVIRWPKGAREGRVIAGGNDRGVQTNQFNRPSGVSFDRSGNLYVSDHENHRIQLFKIDIDSS